MDAVPQPSMPGLPPFGLQFSVLEKVAKDCPCSVLPQKP